MKPIEETVTRTVNTYVEYHPRLSIIDVLKIKEKEIGDIKNINPNEVEDFELLTGGFPCQAFSVAGKMKGELDEELGKKDESPQ